MDLQALERSLLEHPDLSGLSPEEQFARLKERAKHIVGEDRLRTALRTAKQEGRGLRVKYGIDATAKDIHLGHAVPLFVLRRLQNMGHHVVLLIGDFTAQVGDPTGRVSTRPVLTPEEIRVNAELFAAQAGKILDLSRTEVRFNSEWLDAFKLVRFFTVCRGINVSMAMQREDFRKRESVTVAEMLYALLMAIDSVELQSEIELGGDDQLLNFHITERVMENEGLPPESAITTDMLLGTTGDGNKMSKSLGNYIAVTADPADMFGKIMSIPDAQVELYFKLLTDMRDAQWDELSAAVADGSIHPRDAKRLLARVIVADLHSPESANAADEDFRRRIVEKEVPADLPVVRVPADKAATWVALLRAVGISQAASNSDARRLLDGGGVHLQTAGADQVVQQSDPVPAPGAQQDVRVGKRTFIRFTIVNQEGD